DEGLAGPGTDVAHVLSGAAERGVAVKGLIWRSHLDRFYFSQAENRHLGEKIEAAGGEVVRDMRVRAGGSHHQKLVVVRYRGRPERDVAFVGGIDLCHGRNDDAGHDGDPQAVTMSPRYGTRPPWHDIQLAIRGPAVGDVEYCFRERWTEPRAVTRNPFYRLADLVRRDDDRPDPLPDQLPDPPRCGTQAVQVLRTYPYRRVGYRFAPRGERSVAHGYAKAIGQARQLVYLEDQYLWSTRVIRSFADALAANPELHRIAVVPLYPDQPGTLADATEVRGRGQALAALRRAGRPRRRRAGGVARRRPGRAAAAGPAAVVPGARGPALGPRGGRGALPDVLRPRRPPTRPAPDRPVLTAAGLPGGSGVVAASSA